MAWTLRWRPESSQQPLKIIQIASRQSTKRTTTHNFKINHHPIQITHQVSTHSTLSANSLFGTPRKTTKRRIRPLPYSLPSFQKCHTRLEHYSPPPRNRTQPQVNLVQMPTSPSHAQSIPISLSHLPRQIQHLRSSCTPFRSRKVSL